MWRAVIHVGVFWEGYDFQLCTGPRWLVDLRARRHLRLHPYRYARVERVSNPVADGERTDQPEEALMAVADDRAKLLRILGAIIEADERGQGVGYSEAMDAGRAELARLKSYP